MPRLLVTGGAGFIGSNFVHHRLREYPGERLVVLDALTYAGNAANLESAMRRPEFRFVRGDICDGNLVERLLREERIDTIAHFAAESHVDRSIQGPDAFIQTNVIGTHSLLKAARQVWLEERLVEHHRFHHVSTDEVFGSLGPEDPAFHEQTPYAPNSPYSASKAASDHLVRAYHHTYGMNVTTSNCSNNYGPYHFPEKLIPLTITNILQGRKLPIYGDGRNIRDWLYVSDHCRAIDMVLCNGRPGHVYNIGGDSECENVNLVKMLCAIAEGVLGSDPGLRSRYPDCPASRGEAVQSLITFVKDRPGHDKRYAINYGKIQEELAYQPRMSLSSGLTETFRWYVENEAWWRSVMDGDYQRWIDVQYAHG